MTATPDRERTAETREPYAIGDRVQATTPQWRGRNATVIASRDEACIVRFDHLPGSEIHLWHMHMMAANAGEHGEL
jgi:hypothetical protein